MNNELPKELRDLINAAKAYADVQRHLAGGLIDVAKGVIAAVDAYERSQMPQPIEVLITRYEGHGNPDGWATVYPSDYDLAEAEREVWRCTITPHERIK